LKVFQAFASFAWSRPASERAGSQQYRTGSRATAEVIEIHGSRRTLSIALSKFSVEAVVQIRNFIKHLLDQFDIHYTPQVRRFYALSLPSRHTVWRNSIAHP